MGRLEHRMTHEDEITVSRSVASERGFRVALALAAVERQAARSADGWARRGDVALECEGLMCSERLRTAVIELLDAGMIERRTGAGDGREREYRVVGGEVA